MAQAGHETRPHFSQPLRPILMMVTVLILSGVGVFFALPRVLPVFAANPYLNGFIGFVFLIGVVTCFWQVLTMIGSVRWIERFAAEEFDDSRKPPQLLAPLASLLRSRGARMQLNAISNRSLLDSVATRIDEQREITRYIVSLLIFLGLLGTFYGLATTVPAVVDTIRSLAPREGEEGVAVFNRLMTGLESQLGGMGIAFASSLLGLAGSLIVGLLELFSGHGQNRFYRELEEWLSSITRVTFSSGEDGNNDIDVVSGVLDHMAEQMESLQQMFTQSDISRAMVDERLGDLADSIQAMTQRLDRGDTAAAALDRIAIGQEQLIDVLRNKEASDGLDAESRMRLRSIDVQMLRILEEISAGRQESVAEFRKSIDALFRALSRPKPKTKTTDRPVDGDPRAPHKAKIGSRRDRNEI
ncbi:MAG: biopolymer transporter ExbB [Rhodobacteraceae bacterium]|nr:biopolymer transporter ExbB [Paracoccaceae bacterium]